MNEPHHLPSKTPCCPTKQGQRLGLGFGFWLTLIQMLVPVILSAMLVPVVLSATLVGCGDSSPSTNENENTVVCGDGVCEESETAEDCRDDCEACEGVTFEGCCDGNTLHWCDEGTLRTEACGVSGCGWSGSPREGYVCDATGEDPTGLFPRTCGCEVPKADLRPTHRIYNGTREPELACLTPGQILSVGAISSDFGDGYENYCTGTVIADDVVLTAAHCLEDDWGYPVSPEELLFSVGDDVADPLASFFVAEVWIHPDFDGIEAYHDLGVLILESPVSGAVSDLQPLPVNRRGFGSELVQRVVQNVGYGVTEDDYYNTLRWWTTEPITQVEDYEFTVYGNGVSSVCVGDSGGPSLYSFDSLAPHILGTVSWGDSSCVDYDHYCRVDANLSFLDPHLSSHDPCLGLDETGRCVGRVAQWCQGGELNQMCCTDSCGENAQGLYRCGNPPTPCDGVDAQGRCEGEALIWCDNGVIRRRFCNICGAGTCGWVGGTVGFACVPSN